METEIAHKYPGVRNGRWNAKQYCGECAAIMRKEGKDKWQKGNRRDCRKTNQELRKALQKAQETFEVMERTLEMYQAENARLQQEQALSGRPLRQDKQKSIFGFLRGR